MKNPKIREPARMSCRPSEQRCDRDWRPVWIA
jgi:hypothetical protein